MDKTKQKLNLESFNIHIKYALSSKYKLLLYKGLVTRNIISKISRFHSTRNKYNHSIKFIKCYLLDFCLHPLQQNNKVT